MVSYLKNLIFYRHFSFVFIVRQKICPSCKSKTLYVMFTESRQEIPEPKVREEISFHLGGKISFFKNWFEWTLPPHANSLTSFSFKWRCLSLVCLKSLLQNQFYPPICHGISSAAFASVMYSSTLSPWREQKTDSHSQPNSVWLSVSMSVPYYFFIPCFVPSPSKLGR
jgi:hypothetical protein